MRPWLVAEAIWTVDLDRLWHRGIRGLILDLDNTIVEWNASRLWPAAREWIEKARRRPFRICVVSNALRGPRVARVAAELRVQAVVRAGKPFPRAFRRAMAVLKTDRQSTCVIGDQVFTDIVGANWLGLTTILVRPLSPRESPHTRFIRLLERPFRNRWERSQSDAAGRTPSTAPEDGSNPLGGARG